MQPQVFMVLCVISWTQSLVYFHKWKPWKASLLGFATLAVFGGVEAALILTIRVSFVLFPAKSRGLARVLIAKQPTYQNGNETPVLVVGIIAAVLLAVGLLPPYGELWKRRGRVIGINWVRNSLSQLKLAGKSRLQPSNI